MNLINNNLIDLLISAAETLKSDVVRILTEYKKESSTAKKFSQRLKDEDGYYQEEQGKLAATARKSIEAAEKAFCSRVEDLSGRMETELRKHLSEPVNPQFRERLSMLAEFGLQPEKIEIEDLIALNAGNQMGLAALAKTLEKVESPFVLKYHTTADYQSDIAEIRDICRNLKYVPVDYLHEGCEIYKGINGDFTYPDGQTGSQITYDSLTLTKYAWIFENTLEKIKNLKDIWASDCSYSEADAAAVEAIDIMKSANEQLTANGLPAEELPNPKTGTTVEDEPIASEAMQFALKHGREKALENNVLNRLAGYEKR